MNIRLLLLGLSALFLTSCDGEDWANEDQEIRTVIEKGKELVSSLEEYKKETGSYPRKISELYPDFIENLSIGSEQYSEFIYVKIPPEKQTDELYGYTLSSFRDEFTFMGDRSAKRIFFTPSMSYSNSAGAKTVKTIDGWALQNMTRQY